MDRLLWLIGEVGPALWLLPGFLCLGLSAWRGGPVRLSLGLAAILTVAVQVLWPSLTWLFYGPTFVGTLLAQGLLFMACLVAMSPLAWLVHRRA